MSLQNSSSDGQTAVMRRPRRSLAGIPAPYRTIPHDWAFWPKVRGVRRGRPDGDPRLMHSARSAKVAAFRATVLPEVQQLVGEGMSQRKIAAELNRRGLATYAGRPWRGEDGNSPPAEGEWAAKKDDSHLCGTHPGRFRAETPLVPLFSFPEPALYELCRPVRLNLEYRHGPQWMGLNFRPYRPVFDRKDRR